MLIHPVARRYGRALFTAAHDRGLLDSVAADLQAVTGFMRSTAGAALLLRSSPLGTEERQRIAHALFDGRVQPIVVELLDLLLEKKRFGLLDDVAEDFDERVRSEQGIVRVEVRSARALDEEIVRRLAGALERTTGKQVRLERRVDPRLIGGLRVRIGDRVIEHSVRRTLESMRQTMHEAAVLDETLDGERPQ